MNDPHSSAPSHAMAPARDGRTALVFGGSGQIGRPLLARLVAAGWRVIAVSRAKYAEALQRLAGITFD